MMFYIVPLIIYFSLQVLECADNRKALVKGLRAAIQEKKDKRNGMSHVKNGPVKIKSISREEAARLDAERAAVLAQLEKNKQKPGLLVVPNPEEQTVGEEPVGGEPVIIEHGDAANDNVVVTAAVSPVDSADSSARNTQGWLNWATFGLLGK
jgi:hypothetical protein